MQEQRQPRKLNCSMPEVRNHMIHAIPCQNHANHLNLIVLRQNSENHEINKITSEKIENHKKLIVSRQMNENLEILMAEL